MGSLLRARDRYYQPKLPRAIRSSYRIAEEFVDNLIKQDFITIMQALHLASNEGTGRGSGCLVCYLNITEAPSASLLMSW